MASAHFSLLSLPSPFTTRRTPYRFIVSSKSGQRKNYLRPKILKTLTKSYPPIPPHLQPPPPQPILSSPSPSEEHNFSLEIADTQREDTFDDVEELDKLEGLQVSPATTTERNGFFGSVSATAIFKYGGMCLIGAFVFQTVCSFWIFGNSNSNLKDGDLEVSARENSNFLFPDDQLVMEKKIKEIKLMAREVRKIESEKKRKEDEDTEIDDDESSVSINNNFIEKEIDARLLRLQNKMNSNKDSLAALHSNAHGKSAIEMERDGDKSVNHGNDALVFKKKFKFKSPSTKVTTTPKGFSGTQDSKASNAKTTQVNQEDVAQKNTAGVPLEERGELVDDEPGAILSDGKNSEEKKETLNGKTKAGFETKSIKNGGVKDSSVGMSSPEVIHSSGTRESRTHNSQVFVEENQDSPVFEKDNVHSVNGSSRDGLAKQNSAANIVKVKQANSKTDMWWLNLRYVLVILMQRGPNGEGSKGLYSLKFTSKKQEQGGDSYTIAFEDHADANNFCFLLESFFDDVNDFKANAVPMSIQELNEEIISHGDRVVVVKKRQLQLYAGQPLPDVEMALCSIIEQDQNAP